MLPPGAWAEAELGSVDVGDVRRTRRLVKLGAALAAAPSGALPPALPGWAQLKAAYRLLNRPEVGHAAVLSAHVAEVRSRCSAGGRCLLIEDTTQLDFTSHAAARGLGRVGDDGGRGLFLHTTMAVSLDRWDGDSDEPVGEVLGLFDQRCWARGEKPPGGGARGGGARGEAKRSRLSRPRESQRWAACLEGLAGTGTGAGGVTFVADREGDIYETFGRCRAAGCGWLIRACQDRALAEGDREHVFDAVAAAPVRCRVKVGLRARPGHAARVAVGELRSAAVVLRGPWRPGGWLGPEPLNVVEAREVGAPCGAEPLHWVLLTTWPVRTALDCRRAVRAYARRWLVEEYHKCLKTGCSAEASQLATAQALSALLGVLALVALRLLDAKLLARARPDAPVAPRDFGPGALAVLAARFGRPVGGWNNRTVLRATARLGGFLARSGDGDPGWQTIWRGWRKLIDLSEGYALASG